MSWRRPGLIACVIAVAALVPVGIYLWVALHRIGYPYELDWMEGGAVEQVRQLLTGHSLYAPPSLRFTGWTYTPLYWIASAGVAKVVGLGYLPLRLVSFLASIVAMGAIARIVVDLTKDGLAALVAAGLFAATYHAAGDWFDIGRLDSLFVALTLVALAAANRAQGLRGGLVFGVLAFLAFFTKQIALVALAPALLWLLASRWRAGVAAAVVLVVLDGGSTVVLDAVTHGWYRYYIVSELAGQPWAPNVWVDFWTDDLFALLWPLTILIAGAAGAWVWALISRRAVKRPQLLELVRSPAGYLTACVIGLLAAAWIARLHTGGDVNVLMPAYAAAGLVGGVACAQLRRSGRLASIAVAGLLVWQLVVLSYPVGQQIPSQAQHRAGSELLSRLADLPGPILVIRHPWYAAQLGKGNFTQSDGLAEVLRSSAPRGARELGRSLHGALDRYHIQTVVLDTDYPTPPWLVRQLQAGFRLEPAPITPNQLFPPTDLQSAPSLLYVRR